MGKRDRTKGGRSQYLDSATLVPPAFLKLSSAVDNLPENLLPYPDPSNSSKMSPQYVQQLFYEVVVSVNYFYTEHLNDFRVRKAKRLTMKNPCENYTKHTLKIENYFQKKLQKQIKILLKHGEQTEFFSFLDETLKKFLASLEKELTEFHCKSRLLRVILFNEAYSSLMNISNEISQLLRGILSGGTQFKTHCSKNFYEIIAKDFKDLESFTAFNNSKTAVSEFKSALKQLQKTVEEPYSWESTQTDITLSDTEELGNECGAEQLPVDELVKFIGSSRRRRKVRRKPKPGEKPVSCAENEEIEEFGKRLYSATPLASRLKPYISTEYVTYLRTLISS